MQALPTTLSPARITTKRAVPKPRGGRVFDSAALAKVATGNTRAGRVCRFIEKYCRIPEGDKVGHPLKLADFQIAFLRDVYDNPHGTKRAYLSTARKNAKTATIACITLAHLVGPEARQNSRIVSGARSRKQAALVFRLASKMVRLSPELSKIIRIVPSSKTLVGLPLGVEYEALAAESGTAHGDSPVLAILDEVGQVRGDQDDFIEAIETGQGAYDDALLIAISTQAPSDGDLFSVWLDDAERSGDPRIVRHVYAADKDAALDDRAAWAAANPALGLFRSLQDVIDQSAQAMRLPSAENGFRNLILNQRVTRFTPLVSPTVWRECAGLPDDAAFTHGKVYGGLDLSATTDLTALVLIAFWEGNWHVRPYFWTPADTLAARARRDRAPYEAWARDGWLMTTPGVALDYDYIAADIRRITEGMDVASIAFDRHRMRVMQGALDRLDVKLPFVEFGQGYVSMAPAIDALEIEFLQRRVLHGGHPVLTMCAANAVVTKDAAGNRKLDKSKSTARIDGMVALVMAKGATDMEKPLAVSPSPWDNPDFNLVSA